MGAGISDECTEDQVSVDILESGERDHPRTGLRGERLRKREPKELIPVAVVLDRRPLTCGYERLSSFKEADSIALESQSPVWFAWSSGAVLLMSALSE